MILQSLTRYYEIMAKDGKLPKPGYSPSNVSFALNLSPAGEIISILPLTMTENRGKKTVELPQVKVVPEHVTRSVGISPYFMCDNSSYILGMDRKGTPKRSLECFNASRELHIKILKGVHSPAAEAVLAFFSTWEPQKAALNEAYSEHKEALDAGGNMVFTVDGCGFAQDDPLIKKAWEAYKASNAQKIKMQCLVTGKKEPVAILHPKIKGVNGAQSSGANLVSFNSTAYESYGKEKSQGLNSPVSEYAAFAYGTALNSLLSDREHRINIGGMTIVYWAESPKAVYKSIFGAAINPQDENQNKLLDSVMKKIEKGEPAADDVDMKTPFYILGLSPNAARLSVRFFLKGTFGSFLENIKKHYDDLNIDRSPQDFPYITLYRLLLETVNPNSKDKTASPLMSGEVMRSILLNIPYPESLQSAVLLRIRAEQDNGDKHIKKITRGRAAILKAYLLRKKNNQKYKEVLSVSLNEESDNRAYVLGRLFAALEKTQRDASPDINSTIKDRYFTSACATPRNVFPSLFKLYENHIGKIRKSSGGTGTAIYDDKLVCALLGKLDVDKDPFPSNLLLNEQSIFVLGYYHQVQKFFTPKVKKTNI